MNLSLASTKLTLLSQKAVLLPEEQTLVLSDVHLGKATTFQKSGIPVPEGDDAKDLEHIATLVKETDARQLIIAGDFFHSPVGLTLALKEKVDSWLHHLPAKVTLVVGNHDRRSLRMPFDFQTVHSYQAGSLEIVHDPKDRSKNTLAICGHIHPVVKIQHERSFMRLPCFHLTTEVLTLPSFGSFTGGFEVKPHPKERIFIFPRNKVLELPKTKL